MNYYNKGCTDNLTVFFQFQLRIYLSVGNQLRRLYILVAPVSSLLFRHATRYSLTPSLSVYLHYNWNTNSVSDSSLRCSFLIN